MEPGLTQPPMMTFKQFLSSQDDGIDDQEAVKKYNEYKLEFKRQQINEFFLNHKDEEWCVKIHYFLISCFNDCIFYCILSKF